MEPIKELYENMKAAGFITEAVPFERFAAGVSSEDGQRQLYKSLAGIKVDGSQYGGAGLPESEFIDRFFGKKKVQPQQEQSPAASEPPPPDFSGTSWSPNAPAPIVNDGSIFEPQFPEQQQEPVSNIPESESGMGGQPAAAPQATDQNGFAALPSNLIPGAAPRDAMAPQPIVDRGEVKEYAITGQESITGYAKAKNPISRKQSQADAAPVLETTMSSSNKSEEAKAAMVYAEDSRRQADIAKTQLEQAYGSDWRKSAPADDPDRLKFDAAIKAQGRAYDHYQGYTGGTELDGTEDPVAFGESRRQNLPSYDYKKTYDSKTALRKEKRDLDNIAEYGEAARFQTRFSETLLKEKYGENWLEALQNTDLTLSGAGLPPNSIGLRPEEYKALIADPDFQKWQAGATAQNKGYEAFKAKIAASPAYKQGMLEAAASQSAANQASEERPGPEALGVLVNPMYAAQADPLSKNWLFRKGAQLIGAAASLPRTIGRGASGADGGWKVADEIGSWADEFTDNADVAYPKPEQMSRPLYERVTSFNGNEAVVDDKGKLLKIRGKDGSEIEVTPENKKAFEASGAADNAKEKFNGIEATADKVLDAAADLMLYRFMGGGTKPGVIASSFLMQHQNAYKEATEQMKMSAGDAARYALVSSTLTGALEAYLGNIETSFAKPGVAAAIKLGKQEAMRIAGKESGAAVAAAAWKPVIKEVVGENAEEFMQSVSESATKAAYNNMTGAAMEAGMSAQEMKETALVTTLLTAPASALGLPAHIEANRRSALLAAVKDRQKFEGILDELEANQAVTPEEVAAMKQNVLRLSALNSSLPSTMTDDERSHVLALQEFSDKKKAEAAAEGTVPAVAAIAKEDAKEADMVIENMVRDEKANPTPSVEPVPKPEKTSRGNKVAEVVVAPEDTPEVAQAKTAEVTAAATAALEEKGMVVTPEILPEIEDFFVPTVTEAPTQSAKEIPLAETVDALATEFMEEKGVAPKGVDAGFTPSATINGDYAALKEKMGEKEAKKYFQQVNRLVNPNENEIVEYRPAGVVAKRGDNYEFIPIVDMDMKQWRAGKPWSVNDEFAAKEFNLDEKQAEVYSAELPVVTAKVEAMTPQDVADANAFIEEMGGNIDRVIASVNGAIEEMDRQAFEALKKKNPTVHELIYNELSIETSSEVPSSGTVENPVSKPKPAQKTSKTPGRDAGQDVGSVQNVEGEVGGGVEVQGESDTGVVPTSATQEGAIEAAASGLVTSNVAVAAVSGNENAAQAVVDAGAKIEESAELETDINDAVEGQEFQELVQPDGGMTPLSTGIFVTRGDVVYVANSVGFEDILRDMGGNLVPGKGWAFPLQDKWKVAAAMKRTAIASAKDKATRRNSGDEGRTTAAMGDKDVLVTAKKTEKAIAEGKTLEERVAAAKGALHIQENERKDKVTRTIERLKTAFPGIEVVTDPEAIKDVLHKLKIKDAPAGFTYEGKVYIDMDMAGIDTPIHEFGHIWSTFLKANKPKLHAQGVAAMKGTEYEAVVREDDRYEYLNEEADVLDEALAQAIGERGARLGDQNDWLAFKAFMAKAKTAIKNALGFDPMKMSAKQYADTMAAKMLSGDVLMEETSADIAALEKGVKFLFAGKAAEGVSDSVKHDLGVARYMETTGQSPERIWRATNWWRGPDGYWRWEVRDKDATVVREMALIEDNEVATLDAVINHPELYKLYPAIKDVPVIFVTDNTAVWGAKSAMSKSGAQYFVVNKAYATNSDRLKKAILHEIQHAIQYAEGFGSGMQSDPSFVSAVIQDNLTTAVIEKDAARIKALLDAIDKTASDIYNRSSGEVEARNVEARRDMGTENDLFSPEDTMDVAPAEQVVLFMTEGAFDKIVHGFEATQANSSAKFQHSGNVLREASLRAAAAQLVDIEVKSGSTPKDQAVPFIATELGLDPALVEQMWEDAAYKYAPKNMINATTSGVAKSVSNVTNKLGKWANKWLGTYRNLPKEVFRGTVQMSRDISSEMYKASKIGDDLSRALKKHPPEVAGLVQNVLEGTSDWSLLPDDLIAPTQALRNSVDALSRKLLLSGAVKRGSIIKVMENMGVYVAPNETGLVDQIEGILGKPPLERTDEEVEMVDDFLRSHKVKMGAYLNRSYRAHQYTDWGVKTPDGFKRVPPEAVDQARKFFVKQKQAEYNALVDRLAKKESDMAKKAAKLKKLITNGQAVLQQEGWPADEVLSRSAEIGALQHQLDALEKKMLTDRDKIAREMDDVSAELGKIDDVIANYLDGHRKKSDGSPVDMAGKKNESILSHREDVPEELRAILGEYRDPVVNYATSVAKAAHLLSAQDFLNTMRSRYGGIYFHESKNSPPGNYVQVSMDNDPAFGPIDGWWTTPDILEALKDMRTPVVQSQWEKNWANYFVQRVKLGKTIASPVTHARNFIGNIAFVVVNGWNPLRMYQAFSEMAPMFNGGDKSVWRDYAANLHKMGVFGESVSAGDLEALRTYSSWDTKASEVARYATFTEKLMSVPGKAYGVAKKAYEAEDNFYRMMAFENEKRRYAQAMHKKPFSDLSAEERDAVEAKAAEIVSHILPTYSYVPKLVQSIRRFPLFGTFVAFPSEMVRVSYNNIQLATQEMKDARTRSMGIRRLMGAALVHSAEALLIDFAKQLAGFDDEEWDNANKFVPPFEKNGALLPLERDKKGNMGYINMSYTNPYSFIPKAYRAFADDEKSSAAKATFAGLQSLTDPFLSPELSFKAMMQIAFNQDDWGRPIRQDAFQGPLGSTWLAAENVGAQMRFLANKLQPGIVKSIRDAYDISQQNPSRSGKVKSWETFALSHALGLSIQRIDPTFSYGNQMYRLTDQKNQARKNYTSAQKRYNKGYQTVLEENQGDTTLLNRKDAEFQAAMKAEYQISKAAYARILQEAADLTKALRALGIKDSVILQNMGGFSKEEKSAIMSGKTNLQLTFKRKGRY